MTHFHIWLFVNYIVFSAALAPITCTMASTDMVPLLSCLYLVIMSCGWACVLASLLLCSNHLHWRGVVCLIIAALMGCFAMRLKYTIKKHLAESKTSQTVLRTFFLNA